MALDATVRKLRNQVEERRAIAADLGGFIASWQNDVDGLYQKFNDALSSFVKDGFAQVYTGTTTLTEELLGSYPIKTLVIEIVGQRMFLLPIARVTIAGTGRVDLYRQDRPSEDDRILIVRGTEDTGFQPETWMIQDKKPMMEPFSHLAATVGIIRGGRRYRGLTMSSIQDGVDHLLNL